jgi:hypothetical protein
MQYRNMSLNESIILIKTGAVKFGRIFSITAYI